MYFPWNYWILVKRQLKNFCDIYTAIKSIIWIILLHNFYRWLNVFLCKVLCIIILKNLFFRKIQHSLIKLFVNICLGLKELCERNLIETITPENIASRLLIADEFGCDALKKASLAYCEENLTVLNKSLAWKIMEQTNPELFNEVCETGIGSSRSSNMDDSELSN